MSDVSYRELRRSDHARVQALFDEAFGVGYRTAPEAHSSHRLTLVATDSADHAIAVATARLVAHDSLAAALGSRLWSAIGDWDCWHHHAHFGLLEGAVVAPAWRGQGIHQQLVRLRLEWVAAHATPVAFALAWRPERDDFAARTLAHCHFRPLAHVPDYWSEDAHARGYHCPHCGHGCRCTMTLYLRDQGVSGPQAPDEPADDSGVALP